METYMITDGTALFAFLAGLLALIFLLSQIHLFARFFELLPPVVWAYFLPMFASTAGIIPPAHPLYAWMTRYLLPLALFLLMVAIDVPSILKLGKVALLMMVAGTLGIVIGMPLAYALLGHLLPPEAWKGLAALSGSWIGGTANMVAIARSVGTPDAELGPIIVVDTVVGYGWMGVLIFLSAYQRVLDRWIGADRRLIEEVNQRLSQLVPHRKIPGTSDYAVLIGVGFVAAVVAVYLGNLLPALGEPTVISHTTWAVLIVVTAGLLLSFTPARKLEVIGASRVGYLALYLLLTAIGAQADLKAVVEAPLYLLAGFIALIVHILLLLLAARALRAPFFFVATGSMANIGGAASAPIVAGVYLPAMAPVGLLLAVAGYVLGIYAALVCAWILGKLALLI